MRKIFIVTLLASCATVLTGMASTGTANAAAGAKVTPATSVVSCAASNVWLRLWGTLGQSCYSGNGTIVVNLPGVIREQIIGVHTVCLRSGSAIGCVTGPGTLMHEPPVTVRAITIATP
jgi:hypothetical protein